VKAEKSEVRTPEVLEPEVLVPESPPESKEEKNEKREKKAKRSRDDSTPYSTAATTTATTTARPLHVAAITAHAPAQPAPSNDLTLLLFYQYIEPLLSPGEHKKLLAHIETRGNFHKLGGRMRCAREGLNCTLTGDFEAVRAWAQDLRDYNPVFKQTEFKFTDNLPRGQNFPKLNVFPVDEIVNYGLGGDKAPPIDKTAVHLEPAKYHEKMAEPDTVIIDVRNHYEATIGRFAPPPGGAEMLDPKMRKSTEFPVWLNKPETKEKLKGKQVLMYCTGGVRCERAGALLKQQLATEADNLGVKGVYQLQGGIHKYLDENPDGGFWSGKVSKVPALAKTPRLSLSLPPF